MENVKEIWTEIPKTSKGTKKNSNQLLRIDIVFTWRFNHFNCYLTGIHSGFILTDLDRT